MFRRGTLYHLLSNRIYLSKTVHKGEAYEGEQAPIVSQALFDAVQGKLRERASGASRRIRAQKPGLLAGLLFDGEGWAITPTHATKGQQRYHYYVTRPDRIDGTSAWRVPAHDLERLVCERLAQLFSDGQAVHDLAGRAIAKAEAQRGILCNGTPHQKIEILAALIDRIDLYENRVNLTLLPTQLREALGLVEAVTSSEPLILSLPVIKIRRGHQAAAGHPRA